MGKKSWFASLGLLGMLMLVSHQNCAPSNLSGAAQAGASPSEAPMPVTIIDSSKSGANLSFQFNEVQVQPQTTNVSLVGTCDQSQDGATFGWTVNVLNKDGSLGAEVGSGQTSCDSGSFNVDVPTDASLACGASYKVTARLGFGQPGETTLTKNCP